MTQRNRQKLLISIVFGIPVVLFGALTLLDGSNHIYSPLMLLSLSGQQLTLYLTGKRPFAEDEPKQVESLLFSSFFIFVIAVLLIGLTIFVHR